MTVWEKFEPSSEIEEYWQRLNVIALSDIPDPFGLVAWPGSVVAARELWKHRHVVAGSTVLVLGAGPGVEVHALASLGAGRVLATDVHPTTLHLVEYSAKESGLEDIIETKCTCCEGLFSSLCVCVCHSVGLLYSHPH